MQVSDFAEYAERVADTRSRIEKQDIVHEALQEAKTTKDQDAILAFTTNQRFEDSGVAKKTVRNALNHPDIRSYESEEGDLPSAVGRVFEGQQGLTPRTDVPLSKLYHDLEEIESETKTSTIESKVREMLTSYEEPKWVAHALLADDGVSMGFGVKSAAKMIRRYHDGISKQDMAKARALCPNIIELHRRAPNVPTSPEVGTAFKPMLACGKELPDNPDGNWLIQPKFDGARVLVHYDEGDVWVFSRRLNDVTESLPEVSQVTEKLPDDGQYILDGEAVAYKDGEPQDFQHIMTRFNREKNIEQQEIDVKFHFFDMVYATGTDEQHEDLSDLPNVNRLAVLENFFSPDSDVVADTETVYTAKELTTFYSQYVEEGYEGAIVKEADAAYEYDKRSHSWRKAKDMKENADLIIDEIIEGEDSRAGKMGAIRLRTSDGERVGKVGTGFTEEDEEWFFQNREELVGRVMEVEWQEIQQKDDGSWGLRFPVYVAMREKPPEEAASLDWLKQQ